MPPSLVCSSSFWGLCILSALSFLFLSGLGGLWAVHMSWFSQPRRDRLIGDRGVQRSWRRPTASMIEVYSTYVASMHLYAGPRLGWLKVGRAQCRRMS
ncbi:hypothetical protein K466DRAFT_233164 [Polyporus arcularius HHB13444]|uniref:Uncharacterized protein n=1 Tax=Polyporus arcularius HHB13444 TaxID=1314778 RepID=A0A5C3P5D7_9APHY|nr:hypothetical protein K466DRAFT_233164 [Polyporus arcularius HHB13444]